MAQKLAARLPIGSDGPYGSIVAITASADDLPHGISRGIWIFTAASTGMVFEDGAGNSHTIKIPVGVYNFCIKKVTNLDSAVAFALY